jgi:hypothetical protein
MIARFTTGTPACCAYAASVDRDVTAGTGYRLTQRRSRDKMTTASTAA